MTTTTINLLAAASAAQAAALDLIEAARDGKIDAGRLLDGMEWDQMPEAT